MRVLLKIAGAMRRMISLALSLACLLASCVSAAQSSENAEWDGDYRQRASKRSDVALGISGGLMFGNASGYPNEVDKLDEPAFEQNTGAALGSNYQLWLGLAFTDYLSFGLGGGGLSLSASGRKASGGVFLFHIDSFPLIKHGQALSDLALFANFGAGGIQIENDDDSPKADGGFMSYVAFGVGYEHFRVIGIALGPALEFTHMWSSSLELSAATLSLRATYYGGPG